MVSIPQDRPYGYIYIVYNTVSDGVCVGKTTVLPERRWKQYISAFRRGNQGNTHLQRAWDKYGENAFGLVVIEECYSEKELNKAERFYIDYLRCIGAHIYNQREGGDGGAHSEETKQRIRAARLGIPRSPEAIAKMKAAKRAPLSEEQKRKISEGNKGRVVSEVTRQKIRDTKIGRPRSDEDIAKMRAARWGKK